VKINTFYIVTLSLALLTLLASCGGGNSNSESPDTPLGYQGEIIGSRIFTTETKKWNYDRLRLPNKSGGYTYAEFLKPIAPQLVPLLLSLAPIWESTGVRNKLIYAGQMNIQRI